MAMRKNIIIILALALISLIYSCKEQERLDKEETAKVQVKITHITEGYLPDYINLTGKTLYLSKNEIVAPISGYVTMVNVQQGDRISKGKVLFEMQSQESYALRNTDSLTQKYGKIKVLAPSSGIINKLNVFKNNVFIDKGSELCDIVDMTSLFIQANLPYEFRKYVRIGNNCKVILPDSSIVRATFTKFLPQMNEESQSVKILSKLNAGSFIPENMIVQVLVDRGNKHKAQILPKNCLMTNPLMTRFWIMKLINDSVAVSIPVKVGNQTHNQVEILSPEFNEQDRIISEGGYGLNDTALVEIMNK